MGYVRKIFLIFFAFLFINLKAFSEAAWNNDLKTLFLSNNAIIYAINIRTFNAKDTNNNGIIEENLGEEKGTFLNAIDKLDMLAASGINTIHLLPVTPVGKIKALGTAGSLYAISSFDEINPQLKSPNSKLTIDDEFRKFVEACHVRKLRVIVDLPSCGSYELYLQRPELFLKDKNNNPITPEGHTDVRLFDTGNNNQLNFDLYTLYKNFVNLMIDFNIDGIVADDATIKPYAFWKKLIDDTKSSNPQFLFLAQATGSSQSLPAGLNTPYNKLLDAGFDGYYGNYENLKDWKTANDLYSQVKLDIALSKKYSRNKSVIGSFATVNQISPILVNGPQFSKMIIWLNATLPLNSYYIDGFPTGDTYIYPLMNKKAFATYTDDDHYFVHRGQLDIFNFSRSLAGKNYDIYQDFIIANKFKSFAQNIISNGDFIPLRTSSSSIFAYARSFNGSSIIVFGNLDFKKLLNATIYVPKLSNEQASIPIKITSIPVISKGKINTDLAPGEVQVIYFESFDMK